MTSGRQMVDTRGAVPNCYNTFSHEAPFWQHTVTDAHVQYSDCSSTCSITFQEAFLPPVSSDAPMIGSVIGIGPIMVFMRSIGIGRFTDEDHYRPIPITDPIIGASLLTWQGEANTRTNIGSVIGIGRYLLVYIVISVRDYNGVSLPVRQELDSTDSTPASK